MIDNSIFFYFLSIAIAFGTIYISYKMYKDYKLHYLSYWFYYIIFLNLGFYITYTLRFLILTILKLDQWQTQQFYVILFVFVLRPVIIIGLYLFIKFVGGLTEKKLSRLVKKIYLLFWILHSGILFFLTLDYFNTKDAHLLKAVEFLSDWIIIFAFYTGITYIIYNSKNIRDQEKQIAVRMFGYLFFFCQTAFILTSDYPFKLLLSFAYILPPLLYLKRFLKKYFREYSAINLPENETKVRHLFLKYNISKREQDLIFLICKGKSNQEI